MVFCPRKQPRLGPKWQLLTSGPWRIEKVLNSVNYVIRREGGRDRRVVHVDRPRRFDAVAETDVALAGQLTGPRCLSGGSARISANSLSVTSEVIEKLAENGRPLRLRGIPVRLRTCRQSSQTPYLEEETSEEMSYICPWCSKEFGSRSGRSRHCVTAHGCRITPGDHLGAGQCGSTVGARTVRLPSTASAPAAADVHPRRVASIRRRLANVALFAQAGCLISTERLRGTAVRRDAEVASDARSVSDEERAAFSRE